MSAVLVVVLYLASFAVSAAQMLKIMNWLEERAPKAKPRNYKRSSWKNRRQVQKFMKL